MIHTNWLNLPKTGEFGLLCLQFMLSVLSDGGVHIVFEFGLDFMVHAYGRYSFSYLAKVEFLNRVDNRVFEKELEDKRRRANQP